MNPTTNALLLGLLVWGVLGHDASAQPIYRIVDANGKVTFSDKPPASSEQAKIVAAPGSSSGGVASGVPLPFELRQVASKYPVTLYTTAKCAPCDSGRKFLETRGVPFAERTVTTTEDGDALRRLTGDSSLPAISLGAQQLKGYSETEWGQYLDAAGYPKTSVLPTGFKNSLPAPLVPAPAQLAPRPQENAEPPAAAAPAQAPGANPANPAGITF